MKIGIKMKENNWSIVLSFLVPGLGQIGKFRLVAGYGWFIAFLISIYLGIFYGYGWFILTFLIHIFNVLDSEELLIKMFKEN